MQHNPIIAWLYWDPYPQAFVIPIINRPVMWYGICFVLGFILGYFILLSMFRGYLYRSKEIYSRDVCDWQTLLAQLKRESLEKTSTWDKISKFFKKNVFDTFKDTYSKIQPSSYLKSDILKAITAMLNDATLGIDRKALEKLYPKSIAKVNDITVVIVDRLTWFIVIGTILGARLGHVLFYDFQYFIRHPVEIVQIWKGGLASHGGTIGVLISLFLFLRWNRELLPEFSFLSLIDYIVVPTALVGCLIRIGNFINQEIIGYPSTLPWAVIFGHPMDNASSVPRHPVQLYEAGAYLVTFMVLYSLWSYRGPQLRAGILSGLFFIFVFGSRFLIEFLKLPQGGINSESFLQMGQYLSIPFILIGVYLLFFMRGRERRVLVF